MLPPESVKWHLTDDFLVDFRLCMAYAQIFSDSPRHLHLHGFRLPGCLGSFRETEDVVVIAVGGIMPGNLAIVDFGAVGGGDGGWGYDGDGDIKPLAEFAEACDVAGVKRCFGFGEGHEKLIERIVNAVDDEIAEIPEFAGGNGLPGIDDDFDELFVITLELIVIG